MQINRRRVKLTRDRVFSSRELSLLAILILIVVSVLGTLSPAAA